MFHLSSTMLHTIKRMDDFNRSILELPIDRNSDPFPFDLVKLNDDTVELIKELKETIPLGRPNLQCKYKSVRKIPLIHLVNKLNELVEELNNSSIHLYTSIGQLEEIEIWTYQCHDNESTHYIDPFIHNYWDSIVKMLHIIHQRSTIKLLSCNVSINPEEVKLDFEWGESINKFDLLKVPTVEQDFWKPILSNQQSNYDSLQAMMFFLYFQFEVAWDDNKLLPYKEQDDKFITTIMAKRADYLSPEPLALPLSETSTERASEYIFHEFYPYYIELSQKLEKRLQYEQARRQEYVNEGRLEADVLDQIPRWVEQLVSLRNTYTDEILKLGF